MPFLHFKIQAGGIDLPQPALEPLPDWIDQTAVIKPNGKVHLRLFHQKGDPEFRKAYEKIAAKFWEAEHTRRKSHWDHIHAISAKQARREWQEKSCIETLERGRAEWEKSTSLSRFIDECEKNLGSTSTAEAAAFITWAREQAKRLDPFRNGYLPQAISELAASKL